MGSMMKKVIALFMAFMLIAGMIPVTAYAATGKAKVKSVTIKNLDTKTLVLKPKQTFKLKTKVTVSGKASKKVSFSSSNNKVATVSSKGKIKAVKKGTAKITVKSKADTKKKVTIKVIVGTPATKVVLDKKSAEAFEGETITLKATLSPKNPSVKNVKFSTNNKEIATVTSKGVVSCLKEGTATITVQTTDGSKEKATCKIKVKKKQQEQSTATTQAQQSAATTQAQQSATTTEQQTTEEEKPDVKPELSYEGYDLKWSDEFDGTELNREDWNVETHEPGWVNAELQEYVDSTENIYVKDGNLVIKPIKTVDEEGNATYTSGRINTQGNHDFTYGLFETRVKVPTGKGYLPAFWMMPSNENLYGQWPRCGEIDVMEVMGDDTKKAYGTIHYGNPHGQSQGTNVLTEGDYSSEYHTYAVEWEPGKIVWYVDGIKYHEANDWYSTTEGQGTVAYPAPFDQPFYMILNLAIGGSWVGYPDETTTYDDQAFTVDYVKAYQKPQEYYDALENTVEKPEKAPVVEPGEGNNYVNNGDFATEDDFSGEGDSKWQFMKQKGGEATATVVSDNKFGENAKAVKISTTNAGTENYAVQFVQPNIPVKKGGKYKVSFDAYAANNRTMIVDVSAPDYNYARYLNDTTVELTTAKKTFEYEFTVTDHDDANARLEFNLGKTAPISDVYISNIKFEKIGTVTIDDSKKVLTDGNYVYNGKFQEGTETGKKNLQYWDIIDAGNKASYSVTGVSDNRRFKITTNGCEVANEVVLKQTELPLTPGKYELSFDACLDTKDAEATRDIDVTVAGVKNTFTIGKESKSYTAKFEIADTKNHDIEFALGVNGTVLLDNIRLVEDTLIKNGSFNAGTAGYEVYAYTPSNVTYVVDSLNEADNAFNIEIKDTGDQDWHIQLKQSNVKLEKNQWYNLKFKIKSDLANGRKVSYAIQRDGSVHKNAEGGEDWTPYVQNVVAINGDYQTVDVNFKMNYDTDAGSIFNIAMGAIAGEQIREQHRIWIDDISLDPIDAPAEEGADATNLITNGDFSNGTAGWNAYMFSNELGDIRIEDGKITYDVRNPGTEEWHVKLTQEPLTLESGKKYHFTFKVTSSTDRKIKYVFQDPENGYKWYGGETLMLKAGEEKTVDYTFDLTEKETCSTIQMNVNMGVLDEYVAPENKTSYVPENSAAITLSDFVLTEIK